MVKSIIKGSTLEIWSSDYINEREKRRPEDKDAEVIQIEPGGNGSNYIVEVRRPVMNKKLSENEIINKVLREHGILEEGE